MKAAKKSSHRRRRDDPPAPLIDQIDAPPAPPCTLVIFGASGDLTHRLLVPALYNLARAGSLDPGFRVVGVSRSPMTDEKFRDDLTASMKKRFAESGGEFDAGGASSMNDGKWSFLRDRVHYLAADLGDPASYTDLGNLIASLQQTKGGRAPASNGAAIGNVIFYLAVASSLFEPTIQQLSSSQLLKQSKNGWRRLIIEKPFGHDLASAKALDRAILKVLREDQVFRIDHFLGKETVQNIMALRFANGIFEPLWSRHHIESRADHRVRDGGRRRTRRVLRQDRRAARHGAEPYVPAPRDSCAMEAPNSFDANAVRSREGEASSTPSARCRTRRRPLKNSARGRYAAGKHRRQARSPNYRRRTAMWRRDSNTENFRRRCGSMIDNWRWAGVPFYIRTGKAHGDATHRGRHQASGRFRYVLFRETLPSDRCRTERARHAASSRKRGSSLQFEAKRAGPAPSTLSASQA